MKSPTPRPSPFLVAVLVLALVSSGRAEDWFVKGRVYDNVKVTHVNPDTVSINYDGGTGRLALADLPPDIAKRFLADAKKAQAFAALEKKAETDPIDHLIVSLEPMGLLWVNGSMRRLDLPAAATPAELLAALGYLKDEKIIEVRAIEISGDPFTAVRVAAAGGEKIVLLQYEPGGARGGIWFNKVFPSGY